LIGRTLGDDQKQNGSIRYWEISRGEERAGKKSKRKDVERQSV
jgi:hypothetical protein